MVREWYFQCSGHLSSSLFHSSNFEPARALMLVVTLIVALVCMPLSLLLYIVGLIVAWSHPRRRFTQPHSCTDAFSFTFLSSYFAMLMEIFVCFCYKGLVCGTRAHFRVRLGISQCLFRMLTTGYVWGAHKVSFWVR